MNNHVKVVQTENELKIGKAFSTALAFESLEPQDGKWDDKAHLFNGVTHEDFLRYARIVVYKVAHNIHNGFTLNPDDNPLFIDGVSQAGRKLDPPLESHKILAFNPKVSDPNDEQEVARTNVSMAVATLTKCFNQCPQLRHWLAGEISGVIQFGCKVDDKLNSAATERVMNHLFLNDYSSQDSDAEVSRENVDLALSILGEAFECDPEYAWSWHCNIAMPMQDAGVDYMDSNPIAAGIMMHLFNVDTRTNPHFTQVQEARMSTNDVPQEPQLNVQGTTTGRISMTTSNESNKPSTQPNFTVAVFNMGNSAIVVDDGCYVIKNLIDDKWLNSCHIFPEAISVISKLPKNPKDAEYNDSPESEHESVEKEETYSIRHAKREFLAAGYNPVEEEGPNKWVQENVIELLNVFAAQGHSGFSAPFVIARFEKLANHKPLCPLTGDDSEWRDTSDFGSESTNQQNLRCGHVFKDADGNAYDSTGIVFKHAPGCKYEGSCYTGSHTQDGITYSSRVPITFPYTPTQQVVLVDDEGIPLDHNKNCERVKMGIATLLSGGVCVEGGNETPFAGLAEILANVDPKDLDEACSKVKKSIDDHKKPDDGLQDSDYKGENSDRGDGTPYDPNGTVENILGNDNL